MPCLPFLGGYGIFRPLCKSMVITQCRRSSGVERTIGNGEADSSILSGGTILPNDLAEFISHRLGRLCRNCAIGIERPDGPFLKVGA